jgi:hypothetical protein
MIAQTVCKLDQCRAEGRNLRVSAPFDIKMLLPASSGSKAKS